MNYAHLIPIVAVGFLASMLTGCTSENYTFEDVQSDKSRNYHKLGESVASACNQGEQACKLAIDGAWLGQGLTFKNPYNKPKTEVAQGGQSPKPLPLEQVAQAHPVPAVAKVASKPITWGDMTPRQRWEHYKAGHNLPEWDTLKDRERYQYYAKLVATHEGIPPDLFWAQLMQESGYNPKVCSHVGACGIGQFMPATAKAMGLHDRTDPWESIHKAAKYMLLQHKRTGSWELALASYNAGYGAVQKYGGVPPYRETQNYVRTIMQAMKG